MKIANPLQYPISVLVGGLFLIVAARVVRLPAVVAVPGAIAIATAGAILQKSREPETIELDNPALSRELQAVRQQAITLGKKADTLKAEATQLLTDALQVDLLGTVQYACDRTQELPRKIDQLALRMQGKDALLSTKELENQLRDVQAKIKTSTGLARTQWQKLAESLERNIALARQGEDTRQAQLANLSTLIAESGGVLQQLQNKLRTADLSSDTAAAELRELSNEFKGFQESAELLTA
ncbi:MAG: hypothetical protein AAFY78_20920 [Cyanobacteria bacterium J06648_16]